MFGMSRLLTRLGIDYMSLPYDPYSPDVFRGRRLAKAVYWHLFEARVLRGARLIQVMDGRHEAFLRQRRVATPVCVSPAGYGEQEVISEGGLEWRSEGPVRLFFLGRFDARNKGLDLLIEAFGDFAEEYDAILTLQGADRGDRRALERLADQAAPPGRIEFRDPDFGRNSSALTAEHDIHCTPSRFEGFGLAGLEAMLAGRVLLVSDVAGLAPHVAESDSGVVIAPTVEGILGGLRGLMARRASWREMGLRGRRHVLEHLHWDAIGVRTLAQYRSILGRERQPEPA
jgi:glycosyltransferase involved in cell wall biosynthesis